MMAEHEARETRPKPPEIPIEQKVYRAEAMARFEKQAGARIGFVERLVIFWSNHFAISVGKGPAVQIAAGAFEREAIRPHILGKFSDLLLAVESHPAMIFYLDNQRSTGPGSKAGRLDGRGMNENLAREILELHTLGVDGGYLHDDILALGRILSGWSVAEAASETGEPGAFLFKQNWHEPGEHRFLGKTYSQDGMAQGETALSDIARRPATARHIATKLARYFVADTPPPDLVGVLEKTFLETDGDLSAVSAALVLHDGAWNAPATKIRTPTEFLVAFLRATGFRPKDAVPLLGLLNNMGTPLWQPSGPNGFSDSVDALVSPAAMTVRLDVSGVLARLAPPSMTPLSLMDEIFGAAASPDTRQALVHAQSPQQALALLFMSPDFQRR